MSDANAPLKIQNTKYKKQETSQHKTKSNNMQHAISIFTDTDTDTNAETEK